MSSRALEATPGTRWRPTPTVAASIGLHVAAGAGVLLHVDAWQAAITAVAANQGLLAAQAALQEATGRAPRFFRPPAGVHSPLLDPVLHDLGLKLVSWTRRGFDTRIGHASFVAERLTRKLGEGDILLLHDGHAARARNLRPVALHQAIEP